MGCWGLSLSLIRAVPATPLGQREPAMAGTWGLPWIKATWPFSTWTMMGQRDVHMPQMLYLETMIFPFCLRTRQGKSRNPVPGFFAGPSFGCNYFPKEHLG